MLIRRRANNRPTLRGTDSIGSAERGPAMPAQRAAPPLRTNQRPPTSTSTTVPEIMQVWPIRLPRALGIGLGLAKADDDYATRLRAAQIAAIVRLTPLAMGASCLNAVIVVMTLARIGSIGWPVRIWAATLLTLVLRYFSKWWSGRGRDPNRPVSAAAIRRAVVHGALYGAVWGALPVIAFAQASAPAQLLIGCLTAGMMCAGGFVLATVPLAGVAYVLSIAAGAFFALLQSGAPVYLGLTGLMAVYTCVVVINLNWIAFLFIDHFLAEARIQKEVAAREQAQMQAAHAERMIALGQLAGGIAHDFNNTLQAVAGNAELIGRRPNDPGQVRRMARMIIEAAERGGAISRRLLAFARRDALSPQPVDPVALLAEMRDLLQPTLGPSIAVRVTAAPGLPRVLADRRQLETVLLNLASNARDAMPNGGDIILSATSETIAAGADQPQLKPGSYVQLSIADNGVGMDAATLTRAAEPFFTTKPKSQGTGLGLSMAKGFAEQSGGGLAITSEPHRGTVVTLWLPRTDMVATPRSQPEATVRSDNARHILVVDDDPSVREVLTLSLEDAGFIVVGAENGAEALAHIGSGAPVDAMVSDFAMPGMNGLELIRAAQARNPSLPSFLLTGHVGDIEAAPGQGGPNVRFTLLQKPIRPAHLAGLLTDTLNQG
ncbi:MAG TPA: ATP-binding protein [Rhodopila sp.]